MCAQGNRKFEPRYIVQSDYSFIEDRDENIQRVITL